MKDRTSATTPARDKHASLIGPRRPGRVYRNDAGTHTVLAVHHGPDARALVPHSDWAITEMNQLTGVKRTHCTAWDSRDQILDNTRAIPADAPAVRAAAVVSR